MEYFFNFWDDIPPGVAFKLLGPVHCIGLLVIACVMFFSVRWTIKLPPNKRDRVMRIVAVCLPILEITRIVWLYQLGETNIAKLLPLHLCGVQIFFLPWAAFSKNKPVREFVYATALLGGAVALVFLSGIADTYPFFHFQTIQSILYHMILMFVPLVMVFGQGFVPKLSNLPKVVGILASTAFIAGVVDVKFGQNYMFILSPPDGTPLVQIFDRISHPVYLLLMLFLVVFGIFLTYLPFLFKKTGEGYGLSEKTVSKEN